MISEYILILLWIGGVGLASSGRFQRVELVCDRERYRHYWLFAFIAFLPIILLAGARDAGFGDSYMYAKGFLSMPTDIVKLKEYIARDKKDPWFYNSVALLKQVIGSDFRRYFYVVAAIQGICVLSMFRKYSDNYIMSIFLFVASTDYVSWMFNGIRQFTAVSIVLLGTGLALKKKYVPACLVILVAAMFHRSALMMLPLIFIAQGKAWNKKTVFVIVASVMAVFFVGSFTSFLDTALEDTQYTNVVSDFTKWEDDGTNPFRVLVYSVPAIISFFGRKKIQEEDDPLINYCTNMSIFSMGIYIVSMATSGVFIGRLPIYVSLYSYVLLPWEIERLFGERGRLIKTAMIVLYLVFYYFQMSTVFGLF